LLAVTGERRRDHFNEAVAERRDFGMLRDEYRPAAIAEIEEASARKAAAPELGDRLVSGLTEELLGFAFRGSRFRISFVTLFFSPASDLTRWPFFFSASTPRIVSSP
jgi:hypothetical protein